MPGESSRKTGTVTLKFQRLASRRIVVPPVVLAKPRDDRIAPDEARGREVIRHVHPLVREEEHHRGRDHQERSVRGREPRDEARRSAATIMKTRTTA